MSTKTTEEKQQHKEAIAKYTAGLKARQIIGPYVKRGELVSGVKPIRRHKANAELVWIETPFGNQWAQASDIIDLDLSAVPWD